MKDLGKRMSRISPVTAFPFILGVFSGTLLTTFLVLALRTIDDMDTTDKVLNLPHESTGLKISEEPEPTIPLKKTPYLLRDTISYNVLSSREHLLDRVLAIHRSWGGRTGAIEYYLYPPGGEMEINFAAKKRLPLVSLGTRSDFESQSSDYQGVFRAWKDICERKSNKFNWFVKLRDEVYVKTKELERLLSSLNCSEPLVIGQSVYPTGEERDDMGFKEGENYCLESAYAVSWGVLEQVCPMLSWCQDHSKSQNEDVEVARCIRKYAKVNCTTALEMKDLFYNAEDIVDEEELQMGEHHLNPSLRKALILSPLREPDHFYHLHHYLTNEELRTNKVSMKQLRLHLLHTAELGAKSDSLTHTSQQHSPSWTKLGVNSPHHPVGETEQVIHFQSFDNHHKYTESMHYPVHSLSSVEHKDMRDVVNALTNALTNGTAKLTVESVMQRSDPQRGVDYFLQVTNSESGQSMIAHSLREAEPPQVVSLQRASYKTTKVNFVVAAPSVSRGFQRFMMSFESSFLARNPPELVGLLVVLYSEDGLFKRYDQDLHAVTTLLDLYKNKYPHADLRFVSTRKSHSRVETLTIASREFPTYELLFLADIHIDFSMQFLERCRMNAVESKQVYFPAVFNPYNPDEFYKSRILYPHATKFQISTERGSWLHESYHIACVYNYDLVNVLKARTQNLNLLELFIKLSKLTVFRSVEPGLVHLWQDGCKDEDLGKTEQSLCEKLDSILNSS